MARISVRKSFLIDMTEREAAYTLDAVMEKMASEVEPEDWVYKYVKNLAEALGIDIQEPVDEEQEETEDEEVEQEPEVSDLRKAKVGKKQGKD